MKHTPRPKFFSSLTGFLPWLLLIFYFFVFPRFEPTVTPIVQGWINSLGILAPIGYVAIGILATVIAPIGLGPINMVLQRGFGYWPSVAYFWTFVTIGMSVNFWLGRRFGHQFLHLFFAGIVTKDKDGSFNDPITRFSSYMLNKNSWSALAIMLGLGGELLSYLAGLSQLKFFKFLTIVALTNFVNTLIFVGSNLTIGTNNSVYFSLQILSWTLTFSPLILVFHREILSFCKLFWEFQQRDKQANQELNIKTQELKEQRISEKEFNTWYLRYLKDYLDWSLLIYSHFDFFPNFLEKLNTNILSFDIQQKLQKIGKKIGYYPKNLELEILEKEWRLGKDQQYEFKFNQLSNKIEKD